MSIIKTLPKDLNHIVTLISQKAWSFDELKNHLQLNDEQLRNQLIQLQWNSLPVSQPIVFLDSQKIGEVLSDDVKENTEEITVLETISSTNDFFKRAHNLDDKIKICLAEMQTRGKGRTGKPWLSPFGVNIYLSFAANYQAKVKTLSGLTLVFGLSMVKVIKELTRKDVKLKWPNDLLIEGKKITGILVETAQHGSDAHVIVGIGLNVNMERDCSYDVNEIYTSLYMLNHETFDRNMVSAMMLNQLIPAWYKFKKHGLVPFLDEWHKADMLYGKVVSLNYGNKQIAGLVRGINERGHLILQDTKGVVHQFAQGEVSLVRLSEVE